MDKQIYYARQRPGALDLNQDITDTENYGQEIVSNLVVAGQDTIISGLNGTAGGDETINVSAGLAYHSDGKKAKVGTVKTLKWDGTDAEGTQGFMAGQDRIDVVCVRQQYLDGSVVARFFIDNNPASATVGQQITQNVIIDKTDSYQFFVQEGVPNASPSVPTVPSGYIPLLLVYVRRNPTIPYYPIILTTGGVHNGAWNSNIDGDVDNTYFQRCGTQTYNRQHNFVAVNSDNDNIDIGTDTFVRIIGPTGSFTITGIESPTVPTQITLYNTTAQNMTLANEDSGSTDVNRIWTLTGSDITTTGTGVFTLAYDLTDQRWILISAGL